MNIKYLISLSVLTMLTGTSSQGATHNPAADKKLLDAVYNNDIQQLREALNNTETNIDAIDLGWTALMMATVYRYSGAVKILIARGANVNKPDSSGYTPLMRAAINKDVRITRILLDNGADKKLTNKFFKTALDLAQLYDVRDLIHILENSSTAATDAQAKLIML